MPQNSIINREVRTEFHAHFKIFPFAPLHTTIPRNAINHCIIFRKTILLNLRWCQARLARKSYRMVNDVRWVYLLWFREGSPCTRDNRLIWWFRFCCWEGFDRWRRKIEFECKFDEVAWDLGEHFWRLNCKFDCKIFRQVIEQSSTGDIDGWKKIIKFMKTCKFWSKSFY